MPTIEGLDPSLQAIGTLLFVVAVALFSAYHYVNGRKPQPKAAEFAVSGQLADMGPVKKLIEEVGLLVQQQIRTNLHLEANANAGRELVDLVAAHLADQRAERAEREADEEIEERAQQIADRLLKAMKPPRRRVVRKREASPKT